MARSTAQTDLFGPAPGGVEPQADLFAGQAQPERGPRSYAPTPGYVRAYLRQIVDQARAAQSLPWDERKTGFYKQVVPQMVMWLPDDEAARWRLDFEREVARLEGVS